MVKFQVMEIFPENREVLENLPAKTKNFPSKENFSRFMANMVKFNELYQVTAVKWSKRSLATPMCLGLESCRIC
jgi:hypothetical protein